MTYFPWLCSIFLSILLNYQWVLEHNYCGYRGKRGTSSVMFGNPFIHHPQNYHRWVVNIIPNGSPIVGFTTLFKYVPFQISADGLASCFLRSFAVHKSHAFRREPASLSDLKPFWLQTDIVRWPVRTRGIGLMLGFQEARSEQQMSNNTWKPRDCMISMGISGS